ncbi:hypothetical protein WICANDRAFT_17279, partial [Wickerhamomyces anomalus NRRL Y-366-8]
LIEASAKNPSVLMELDMDGNVKHLGKAWESIIGTKVQKILNRPISNIVLGDEDDKKVFNNAISIMTTDDASYRVRFVVATNDPKPESGDGESFDSISTNGEMIELEGQGILIHNSKNIPTHSMWILKPFYANALNVQLPTKLSETLGFGADIFTSYLSALSEAGIINEDEVPAPPQVLCRICEQQVPSWWLEKHSQLCFNEHKCESEVQDAHDALVEQKQIIATINESLSKQQVNLQEEVNDYKGLPLPKVAPSDSPVARNATPLVRRGRSASIFGALRFPFKTLALLSELCEQATSINPSEFNEESDTFEFSPNTKQALEEVSSSAIPESSDPAIILLSKDTEKLVKDKVDAVSRLNSSLLYSQKIKDEVDEYVIATISETIKNIRNQTYDVVPSNPSSSSERLQTSTEKNESTNKLVYPRPTSVQSNIFTDAYLKTDNLPSPSRESIREALNETRGQYSPSRSITPNEALKDSNQEDHVPSFSDLNIKSPILTPQRKGSPGAPPGFHNSPMSSIQRNVKSSGTPSFEHQVNTPFSSPLILAHDPSDHFEKRSSGDNNYLSISSAGSGSISTGHLGKPPLSPLLVAVAPKPSAPSIKDYEVLKPISKGAFGSVYLARRKVTGDYFAIKVLKKADMIAKNQVTNVKSERAVMMAQSESPYVAKLYSSFQSKDYLFLVMEYLPGGDLSTLVKMLGNLPDEWAKHYIAEVVIGVDDLHKKGIVHHDLKPDNLLIASSGHLKLTDFGLSRMGLVRRQERAHKHSIPGDDAFAQAAMSSHHRKSSSVTPFSLSASGPPSANDFSSAGSSPTSSFFENMIKGEKKKEERSGSGSSVVDSPLLRPLHRSASQSSFALEENPSFPSTPTTKNLALFDPENTTFNKKFVGTPDYLSPETIQGTGENEASDWWSVGCILFEFLFGYPPFHAKTPEKVFENILNGRVDWPNLAPEEELAYCSPEAKNLIKRLLDMDPETRLGVNGAQEIKDHPYFSGVDWDDLYNSAGSFVPVVDDPESTDYFESRGAALHEFPSDGSDSDADDSMDSKNDAPRTQVNSTTALGSPSTMNSPTSKHLSLAIPVHLRERRPSKLNDNSGEFGSFQFRNLPALDKANKDVINRIKAEHLEHRSSMSSSSSESGTRSRNYSISSNNGLRRAVSPSSSIMRTHSPSRMSINSANAPQSVPLHERLNSSASRSGRSSPRSDSGSPSTKSFAKPQTPTPQGQPTNPSRVSRSNLFHRAFSDFSPSSSDTEDSRSSALQRVRKRRQSSKFSESSNSRLSILDILLCEPIPILRYSMKKNLESLGCAVVAVSAGDEIVRRATGEVKFDLIITALKLPKLGAIDIAKLLKHTSSVNSETPVIAATAYYKEATTANIFSDVLEKPVGRKQLKGILEKHCRWKIDRAEEAVSDTE